MKILYIIVDCSGSIVSDDTVKIGQINDLLRDLINSAKGEGLKHIQVICYANGAKLYWDSTKDATFYDISETRFGGRSNLGQAYMVVENLMVEGSYKAKDCGIALITDGEATDNFKKALYNMDKDKEAFRIAYLIGDTKRTAEAHASAHELIFSYMANEREAFIDRITENIK